MRPAPPPAMAMAPQRHSVTVVHVQAAAGLHDTSSILPAAERGAQALSADDTDMSGAGR